MDTWYHENSWDGAPIGRHAWVEAMSMRGLACRFDTCRSGASKVDVARAGQTDILNVELAWQSVSPIFDRARYWNGEHLFVKVVLSGAMAIEQRGQTMTFEPGEMAVIDPLHSFNESFCEPTRLSVLRVPKSALRERGLRHRFAAVYRPDPASADVGAVRASVLNLSSQAGKVSDALLARLGDQCLDLMDVLVSDRDAPVAGRANVMTVLRAKQAIARRIGDPELSVVSLASELNISASCLTRALKAAGLSPMRYAWSLRLEHATRLLSGSPPGPIQEIAYQCGFASAAHFSRAFKERYGMTPREYMASRKPAGEPAAQADDARAARTAHAEMN
ncbi:AraC family transcriptional regulator [Paraburkholderia solisilvae]|uniref:HTH-type transcriptional activator RhaS n=1 Tax=Paraburkholderia solisilvae TaxID=624376 RepID=A0A6J5EPD4_9BURK|nr:AraC family transcriptional regulator [Paraburkholderia solisilvae]CAB3767092.1 HTH-type transcriptional activator RhaS [Paraburkholderia solisilvae]